MKHGLLKFDRKLVAHPTHSFFFFMVLIIKKEEEELNNVFLLQYVTDHIIPVCDAISSHLHVGYK